MTAENDLDRTLGAWFQADAMAAPPPEPLARVLASTRGIQPRPAMVAGLGSGWVGARSSNGTRGGVAGPRPHAFRLVGPALLVALLAAALVGTLVLLGSRLVTPQPPLGGVLAVAYADRLEFADADGSNPGSCGMTARSSIPDGPSMAATWRSAMPTWGHSAPSTSFGQMGPRLGESTALSVHWSPYDDDRLLVRVGERGLHMIEADGTLVHDFGQPSGPGVLDTFAWAGTDTVHMHFSDGTGSMDRMTGEGGGSAGGGSVAFPSPFSDLNPTVLLLTDSNPSVRLREDSGFRLTRTCSAGRTARQQDLRARGARCSTLGISRRGSSPRTSNCRHAYPTPCPETVPWCCSSESSTATEASSEPGMTDRREAVDRRLVLRPLPTMVVGWPSDHVPAFVFGRLRRVGDGPGWRNQIEVGRGVSGVDLQPIQRKDPLRSELVPGPTLGGSNG